MNTYYKLSVWVSLPFGVMLHLQPSFLQIFYLDRLDLETTNREVPCGVLPRVAAYDCNSIYNAINLDRQPEWPEGGHKLFGKLKVPVY